MPPRKRKEAEEGDDVPPAKKQKTEDMPPLSTWILHRGRCEEFVRVYTCFATDLLARCGRVSASEKDKAIAALNEQQQDRFRHRRRCMMTWRFDKTSIYIASKVITAYIREEAAGNSLAGGNLLYRLCVASVVLNETRRLRVWEAHSSLARPLSAAGFAELLEKNGIDPMPPPAVLQSARTVFSHFSQKSFEVPAEALPAKMLVNLFDEEGKAKHRCVVCPGFVLEKGDKIWGWKEGSPIMTKLLSPGSKPVAGRVVLYYPEAKYYDVFAPQYVEWLGAGTRCVDAFNKILAGPAPGSAASRSQHTMDIIHDDLLVSPFVALIVARWIDIACPQAKPKDRLFDSESDDSMGMYARAGLYVLCGKDSDASVSYAKAHDTKPHDITLFKTLTNFVARNLDKKLLQQLKDIHAAPLQAQTLEHMLCEYRKMSSDGRKLRNMDKAMSQEKYKLQAEMAMRVYKRYHEACGPTDGGVTRQVTVTCTSSNSQRATASENRGNNSAQQQ